MKRTAIIALLSGLAGCESFDYPQPEIFAVQPNRIPQGRRRQLAITGENFHIRVTTDLTDRRGVRANTRFRGAVGNSVFDEVIWQDTEHLQAWHSADLEARRHDLTVKTPMGLLAVLADAIDIVTSSETVAGGESNLPPNETQVTVPVAVDPSQSVLFFNIAHNEWATSRGQISGQIRDANSLIFQRHDSLSDDDVEIQWSVVTLPDAYVQRGAADMTGWTDSVTTTLTDPVDSDRTFVLQSVRAWEGGFGAGDWILARLTPDGSAVTVSSRWAGDLAIVEWQVAELPLGATVQNLEVTMADDALTLTVEVAPVPLDSTFLIFSHDVRSDLGMSAPHLVRGRMVSDHEVTFVREHVGPSDPRIAFYLVTWERLIVQRGSAQFDVDELERVITLEQPADPTGAASFLPALMRQGSAPFTASGKPSAGWFATHLSSDGSQLIIRRGNAEVPATADWTVIEVF